MSRGSVKTGDQPSPNAISKWPDPPADLNPAEVVEWNRLGESLMEVGTAAKSDLRLVRIAVKVLAKCEAVLDAPGDIKLSSINSAARLAADLLQRLGLTPQGRKTVSTLSKKTRARRNEFAVR